MAPSYIGDLGSKFQYSGVRMSALYWCLIAAEGYIYTYTYAYVYVYIYNILIHTLYIYSSCACYADSVLWALKNAAVFSMQILYPGSL